MRRLLLTILLSVASFSLAWAADFSVPMQGFSLYFNILYDEENAVEVTYPMEKGNSYWQGFSMPSGVLNIPERVSHNGVTYTVVAIGERAFSNCTAITSLTIPRTVTEIGAYAFYHCTGISGKVTIGENVVKIGRSSFYDCTGIMEVQFNATSCESMGGSQGTTVFGNCRKLKVLTFAPTVKVIPDYAFSGMDVLNGEWQLPRDLEYIGEYAFAYCSNLKGKLVIPEGVKRIGVNAFAQCHNIKQLELPSNIERLDTRAFYQCVGLIEVYSRSLVPPELGEMVFSGIGKSAVLVVDCISAERYKNSPAWNHFSNQRILEPCVIELKAKVAVPGSGTVLGTGTYSIGSKVKLVAVCNSGFGFRSWQDGNTDNPREVTVDDTITYVANMVKAEVIHQIEYVHDTIYKDGIKVEERYYEINDRAEPIASQQIVVYNRQNRRVEINADRRNIIGMALYDDAGHCLFTGNPRHGKINMRRFKTGYFIVRLTTTTGEVIVRFFHSKK